ncbi:alpha/beta hydrolase [Gordonia hydrophobica]|uniref:Alpha/beta hydrolase n=1 Tax=Gordonia hydrophobica TaxID=40516 RepID=A0ABZ2U424_9ACTN|nr:alpha/beta hydrolase [Gordonia hydrophobica]MBM7367336.1 pimeloyl-ACP methyl ester carboxylesterase [Gordonia hydrophobica]
MTSVSAVLAWPLDALLAASTEFAVAGESAGTADTLRRTFDIDPTWSGRTRVAAQARVAAEVTRLRRLERTFVEISETLRAGQSRMGAVQDRLRSQLQTARVTGFNVGDNGAVAHPDPQRRADADYLMDRIRSLLDQADMADVVLGAKLKLLTGQLDGSGTLVPLPNGEYRSADEAANALSRMTAEEVARYWESLNAAERATLVNRVPELIGNLNGVDFTDRIQANRLSIQAALAKELAAGRSRSDKAEHLRSLLAPASDPLRPGTTVPRTFLGFHDVGNGRFIELVGDVTVDSPGLAVLVPGTGTGLHNADDYRRRAANIAKAGGSPVIVYADGEFPQSIVEKDFTPLVGTAVDPTAARTIAPDLVGFTAAVERQMTASGRPTPITVIGHSYGGAIVGTAEQLGLRADRVVYASASGTGVGDGPWHNPNPVVERYSLTPPGDPIQYWQKFGEGLHGGDPDSTPGVTRLDSGYYSDGTLVAGGPSHSGYLDDAGSDAVRNLGAVIAGEAPTPYVKREPDIDASGDLSDLVTDWLSEKLHLVPGH